MTDHDVIVALVAFDVLLVVVGYFAIGVGLLARRSVRRAARHARPKADAK